MRRSLLILKLRSITAMLSVAVLLHNANCASAQVSSNTTQERLSATSDKQQAAEAAIDRLQQRFYETLDFATIWKEMYVSDPRLRKLEVEAIIFGYIAEAREAVSHKVKERAYVAMWNFWHTFSAARFTSTEENLKKLFDEMKEPYESMTGRGRPFASEKELEQDFTGGMNRLSEINRKYIVREQFNTAEYKNRLARFRETEPAEPRRIKEIFIPAGLKKDTEIYVVDREIFHYYLIEEEGAFKVLTILNRRRL